MHAIRWLCAALSAAVLQVHAQPSVGTDAAAEPGLRSEAGAEIYNARCAGCHDVPDTRAPSRTALQQMSVNRIIRTMDFGTMMSVTYMLDRDDRETVARWLGVEGDDRAPSPEAYCEDRSVTVPAVASRHWNGWSPSPSNTRFQAEPGLTAEQIPSLELRWAFGFDGDVNAFAPPAVLDDQLFVGSASGIVYALDAKTGCIKWHYAADGPVRTAMVVAPIDASQGSSIDATQRAPIDAAESGAASAEASSTRHALFFGDQSGGFYTVAAETGELLWRARPEEHEATKLTGAPLAHDGVVYVPVASWEESRPLNPDYECCTFRGSIVAYRSRDGERLWKSYLVTEEPEPIGETDRGVPMFGPSGAGTWSAPTLDAARGVLYVTTGNNYTGQTAHTDAVVALDIATGDIAWSSQLTPGDEFNLYCRQQPEGCPGADYDIGASAVHVVLPDGRERLLIGQKSGVVFGLDPADEGRVLWEARVGEGGINGGVLWGMASDGDRVYAAVSDLARRQQPDRDAVDPRPNGVDPTRGGGLTALNVVDGSRMWHAPPPVCPDTQPVCSPAQPAAVSAMPGVVFSGAVDGHLRAFSAADGRVLWDFDTAREFEAVNGVPARGGSIDGDGAVIAGGFVYITSGYGRNGGMPGNVLLAFGLAE